MNDHKNTILAFALLADRRGRGWEYFFAKPEVEKQAQTQQGSRRNSNAAQPGDADAGSKRPHGAECAVSRAGAGSSNPAPP